MKTTTHAQTAKRIARDNAAAKRERIEALKGQAQTYDDRGDTVLRDVTYRTLRDMGIDTTEL